MIFVVTEEKIVMADADKYFLNMYDCFFRRFESGSDGSPGGLVRTGQMVLVLPAVRVRIGVINPGMN